MHSSDAVALLQVPTICCTGLLKRRQTPAIGCDACHAWWQPCCRRWLTSYCCDAGGGGLLSGANAQDKNLAFSKVVRKAYRTVFKRVIRPLLNRNFSNQLPLCTSNHCIVLPGVQLPLPALFLSLEFLENRWHAKLLRHCSADGFLGV